MRPIKCRTCGDVVSFKERFEKMEVVQKSGKNLYYHKGECYQAVLDKQASIDRELAELDHIDVYAKGLHGFKTLPPMFFTTIQDWRNGSIRYRRGSKVIKKFKDGIPYPVILEAYKLSSQAIEWAKLNKNFKDTQQELRYCLSIVQSKLNDAYMKMERAEAEKKTIERRKKELEREMEEELKDSREVKYKKKKADYDISDLFD